MLRKEDIYAGNSPLCPSDISLYEGDKDSSPSSRGIPAKQEGEQRTQEFYDFNPTDGVLWQDSDKKRIETASAKAQTKLKPNVMHSSVVIKNGVRGKKREKPRKKA